MADTSFITPELVGVIITAIIGLVAGSTKFIQIKTKLTGISNVLKEIDVALADNKITPTEAKRIMSLLRGLIK